METLTCRAASGRGRRREPRPSLAEQRYSCDATGKGREKIIHVLREIVPRFPGGRRHTVSPRCQCRCRRRGPGRRCSPDRWAARARACRRGSGGRGGAAGLAGSKVSNGGSQSQRLRVMSVVVARAGRGSSNVPSLSFSFSSLGKWYSLENHTRLANLIFQHAGTIRRGRKKKKSKKTHCLLCTGGTTCRSRSGSCGWSRRGSRSTKRCS